MSSIKGTNRSHYLFPKEPHDLHVTLYCGRRVGFARWRFVSPRLVPVNITRVMVAVDGSDHSKKAAEPRIRFARLWNAQLYFIHVREEDKIPKWFREFATVEKLHPEDYFEIVNRRLFAPLITRAREAKVQVFSGIRARGDPADEILRNAERRKVDLIVMGSRGLGKFSRLILGSVSTKVLSNAQCTCIIVK